MIPWRATYRLQLTPTFAFPEVERLLPYLARLGVSHLYLSPILEARSGSSHGYDGIDPRVVRREFGGEAAFRSLACAAHGSGLGVLVDIVPNHLAVSAEGAPFLDVLENGKDSRFAPWFDVDWEGGPEPGRIAIPWLDPGRARNYRRYLDIDDLIGIRVEDEAVFSETHRKILELAWDGLIDGVRVDHVDGLTEPAAYLARLRHALPPGVAIFAETSEDHSEFGVTGYDALSAITLSLLSAQHESAMEGEFEQVVGGYSPDLDRKLSVYRVLEHEFAAELRGFASRLRRESGAKDFEPKHPIVHEVLRSPPPSAADARVRRWIESPEGQRLIRYVRAKAIEDTYLYRDVRVLARNELGVEPGRSDRKAIEAICRERTKRATSLTPTSTHDTKRSEDARARLVALTRHAARFRGVVERQCSSFRGRGGSIDGEMAWFVIQEWIAIRPEPASAEALHEATRRLEVVAVKAARESKLRTSWAAPNEAYETNVTRFVRQVTGDARLAGLDRDPEFDALEQLARQVANEAVAISLAHVVMKCLLPGIPDFYQGMESIRPLLVDPDNRIPPDFTRLEASLSAIERDDPAPISKRLTRVLAEGDASRLKHFVTRELLRFRASRAEFLDRSDVAWIEDSVDGAAVLRRFDDRRELCLIVARERIEDLTGVLTVVAGDGAHPTRRDWFTDRVFAASAPVSMSELLAPLGFALLVSE